MDVSVMLKKAQEGDKESRDTLVKENMGLVWSVVRRFSHRGYEQEDLFQIGVIGLMKAIDYFDLTYSVKFSTYAVPMITGEIKRFLRDDGMIKVSRSIKENGFKIHQAREDLANKLGRDATISEVSEATGLSGEEIMTALEANSEVESLYKTIYQGDGSDILLVDKLLEDKDQNQILLDKIFVAQLLETLTEGDRRIILMRYYCNRTQTQIAQELGISQVQVSRMEKKILKNLRNQLADNHLLT